MNRLSRRTFLRRSTYGIAAALTAGPAVLWYGADVETGSLEVTRVKVSLPRLPRAFEGMTIAQISDLHLGQFVRAEEIGAAVDAVLDVKPDLAVVTGDFVTRRDSEGPRLIVQELSRLRAPLGVLAVLGNHDHWSGPDIVAGAIRQAGLTLLSNANFPIDGGGDRLYVVGVDDVWERRNDLQESLKGVPDDGCAVLLAHEPDYADAAARDQRLQLQISGHSHGGQIRLPGFGPPHLPMLARKYPEGLRKVGEMWLYTNRGIGVIFPPVRLNCRPEVTLFELAREA